MRRGGGRRWRGNCWESERLVCAFWMPTRYRGRRLLRSISEPHGVVGREEDLKDVTMQLRESDGKLSILASTLESTETWLASVRTQLEQVGLPAMLPVLCLCPQ